MRLRFRTDYEWQGEPVSVVGAKKIVSIRNDDHVAAVIAARRRAGIGEAVRSAA